jgi:hypothetical protein
MKVEIGTAWPRNSFSENICFEFFGIGSLQCVVNFVEHSFNCMNSEG